MIKKGVILAAIFLSCNEQNIQDDLQKNKNLYWLYSPVIEVVDRKTEAQEFIFSDSPFNKVQTRVLISVLKNKGYDYKVTVDSQVLISKNSVPQISGLTFIESEMKQILKDTSQSWRWK